MHNVARQTQTSIPHLEYATVVGGDENAWMVQSEVGTYAATRAHGCLVVPQVDDTVLVSISARAAHIISVIEREDEKTIVGFAGEAAFVGPQLLFHTSAMTVSTDSLEMTGETAQFHFKTVKWFAQAIDTMAERLLTRAKTAFRIISGIDQLRAGLIKRKAKGSLSLHGDFTQVTADRDVSVQGRQIHLG